MSALLCQNLERSFITLTFSAFSLQMIRSNQKTKVNLQTTSVERFIFYLRSKAFNQARLEERLQAGWRNIISSKLDTPKDLNLSSFLERALWVHPDGQNNIVQLVHRFDLPRPSSHQLHVTKSDQTRLRFL